VERLYRTWNLKYCQGSYLYYVGLENEPYFKYFAYADFLTPHSGLIQIRKYAEQEGLADMLAHFAEVSELTKAVRARLYEMLVEEMQYFGSPLQEKAKVQRSKSLGCMKGSVLYMAEDFNAPLEEFNDYM